MAKLLLLTNSRHSSAEVLPSLSLLQHQVRILPAEVSVLVDAPSIDLLLVDARRDLVAMKNLTRLLTSTGVGAPVVVVVNEGGLPALTSEWGAEDCILDSAGPAEVEARIRLAITRFKEALDTRNTGGSGHEIRTGEVSIDDHSYTARVKGRALDLTYKEFELLKHLAQHPGRVFTRAQLLQEVWGYDYFGGTRTVDVHIRRLRAKLGPEFEAMISTVRQVGYRFNAPGSENLTGILG